MRKNGKWVKVGYAVGIIMILVSTIVLLAGLTRDPNGISKIGFAIGVFIIIITFTINYFFNKK